MSTHRAHPDGYLARPEAGSGAPVLVLHAWWGLNETMKVFCDRLAEAGYVVFAPDLYHGQVADTIEGAEALGGALDDTHLQAKREIAESIRFLQAESGHSKQEIAIIGFSLGAYYALDAATALPDNVGGVVLFYGTGEDDFGTSRAEYLGHFAASDEYEPESNVDALEAELRKAGRPVTFYRYPDTGHWFFEPDRTDAYDPQAAALAWERTLQFLSRVV